ncbi:MAG: hypothetical protein IPM64_11325 [Phycisphaerales bacterium]|nr:hypothetical protein [Phycisphaerales bacterium]
MTTNRLLLKWLLLTRPQMAAFARPLTQEDSAPSLTQQPPAESDEDLGIE